MNNTQQSQQIKKKATLEKDFIETYNLTHDNCNGYQLKFDDINWTKNVNSLKPLVTIVLIRKFSIFRQRKKQKRSLSSFTFRKRKEIVDNLVSFVK